ncbi:outer membrane protein TolC [Pedobacter sp. CG_S7]|uniref:TolC family protein n=1 Tax=Pedobacter sp. CG_S7 TaxID=3143930 RepID=UPI003399B43A
MMKYLLQLPFFLAILLSIPSMAQQSNTLSLNQAWEQASNTYPGLKAQEAHIGEYEFNKKEVQSRSLPQVQLQAQNSYGTFAGSNGAFFPVPGIFNVTGNSSTAETGQNAAVNTYGSVLMDWKIFEFGKQRKAVEAAEYQVQGAKSSYDAAGLSLKTKVTRLYFEILYSYSNLIWAKQHVKRVKEIMDLSVSLAQAGLKPGADTSLTSSSYSQAMAYQKEWQGKYNASKINMTEVVPQQDFVLPQESFLLYNDLQQNTDSVSLSHPYLQVLNKEVLYEKAREAFASRKVFPTLSILGGLSTRGSDINTHRNYNYTNNYLIGIGLTWNISGAYTSSLEKKRAEKTVQSVVAKYELQKLQMNTSLAAVSERILQQQQQVLENNMAQNKAKEAYELYLSRYEGGLINLTDLLQIQFLLQSAEKEAIEAQQVLWSLVTTHSEISGDFNYLSTHFN